VITAEDIRRADAEYKAATVDAEAKRQERQRVIKQALTEGWTHARVAAELGVSRGRIGQM
jgi:DNA-binding NarL/FixJ family response regulator